MSGPDDGVEAIVEIAADHPAFAGHFPGAPVLPGAFVLALVMQTASEHPALAARLGDTPQVQHVKFVAPVGPGQRLVVRLRDSVTGIAFQVACGAVTVARGQLGPGPAA
jgi:3-hydroxymyristoyl/3-hydroxydecanoyl-(acyl carrier protein) dehydratase